MSSPNTLHFQEAEGTPPELMWDQAQCPIIVLGHWHAEIIAHVLQSSLSTSGWTTVCVGNEDC